MLINVGNIFMAPAQKFNASGKCDNFAGLQVYCVWIMELMVGTAYLRLPGSINVRLDRVLKFNAPICF